MLLLFKTDEKIKAQGILNKLSKVTKILSEGARFKSRSVKLYT